MKATVRGFGHFGGRNRGFRGRNRGFRGRNRGFDGQNRDYGRCSEDEDKVRRIGRHGWLSKVSETWKLMSA